MLLYEVVVFVLLLAKGLQEHWRAPATLWHTLLLDGALYFLAISLSNVANIVCYLVRIARLPRQTPFLPALVPSSYLSLSLLDPTPCVPS